MNQVIVRAPTSTSLKKAGQAQSVGIRALLPQERRQVAGGGVCNPFTRVCKR